MGEEETYNSLISKANKAFKAWSYTIVNVICDDAIITIDDEHKATAIIQVEVETPIGKRSAIGTYTCSTIFSTAEAQAEAMIWAEKDAVIKALSTLVLEEKIENA